jgi:hypothetical protein
MALDSIGSERQLVEQIGNDLLFRWLEGLSMEGRVGHHATFTEQRDRLPEGKRWRASSLSGCWGKSGSPTGCGGGTSAWTAR